MPRSVSGETSRATIFIAPQLATLSDVVPMGSEWLSETKFDGYRMQCHVANGRVRMISRNALDWTARFASIVEEIANALGRTRVILDGEIVLNKKGRASFHALQSALGENDTSAVKFMVFDVMQLNGVDVRGHALTERRTLLEAIFEQFAGTPRVQLSKVLRGSASSALTKACARGDEGIICKRKDSTYQSGRGRAWLKVKCGKRQEFVVVGYSEPKGSREGLGALLLGVYDAGKHLHYAGRVGSGFATDDLVALRARLGKLIVARSPLSDKVKLAAVREVGRVTWVKPKLVVEVSFTEWTSEGLLRHSVYQGLRSDKAPTDIKRELA